MAPIRLANRPPIADAKMISGMLRMLRGLGFLDFEFVSIPTIIRNLAHISMISPLLFRMKRIWISTVKVKSDTSQNRNPHFPDCVGAIRPSVYVARIHISIIGIMGAVQFVFVNRIQLTFCDLPIADLVGLCFQRYLDIIPRARKANKYPWRVTTYVFARCGN